MFYRDTVLRPVSSLRDRMAATTELAAGWASTQLRGVREAVRERWRTTPPRRRAAWGMGAAAAGVLVWAAWPLVVFAASFLPEFLLTGRLLLGAAMTGVVVAAYRMLRPRDRQQSVGKGWPVVTAWATAVAAASGTVAAVWLVAGASGWDVLPERWSPQHPDKAVHALAAAAVTGAAAALAVLHRRQRTAEAAEARAGLRLFTERFTAATAKLGSDHAAVRLAGVHALAQLADDAPTRRLRQTCIDVLCACLRVPHAPEPGSLPDEAGEGHHAAHPARHLEAAASREVRHTILRVIGARLREDAPVSWQGHDFDFTGVVFDGVELDGACFTGGWVSFRGARFTGGRVSFHGARFTGGTVDFSEARFCGGIVDFFGAVFTAGLVDFSLAVFAGGEVRFRSTRFRGGDVDFHGAVFSGGTVDFGRAVFSDGWVNFGGEFSGSEVVFAGACFTGGVVHFITACFCGGDVDFGDVVFSGGTVDFSGSSAADGEAPKGLRDAADWAPEGVLLLPAAWRPCPHAG